MKAILEPNEGYFSLQHCTAQMDLLMMESFLTTLASACRSSTLTDLLTPVLLYASADHGKHILRLEGLLIAHTMSGALFVTALSSQLSSKSASSPSFYSSWLDSMIGCSLTPLTLLFRGCPECHLATRQQPSSWGCF